MWLLTLLLGIVTLVLAWVAFGYFLTVRALGTLAPKRAPAGARDGARAWPRLSVLVPCRDEEALSWLESLLR